MRLRNVAVACPRASGLRSPPGKGARGAARFTDPGGDATGPRVTPIVRASFLASVTLRARENSMVDNEGAQLRWVPTLGTFTTSDQSVVFLGKLVPIASTTADEQTTLRPSAGLALSSATISDGTMSADVTFEEMTKDSVCELTVAYDANAQHLVTAGLGGQEWAMFGIREFGGPRPTNWWDHRIAGERGNLKAGHVYHLEADFRGANVNLRVDGVPVAAAEVTSPLGRPRQAGLFCKGAHRIVIKNFSVRTEKPKAFVVMQFTSEFDDVYNEVVRDVCVTYDMNVLRADEVHGPGLIISDVVTAIAAAQLIIADITPVNANVYFEIGYALALSKPTILLAKKGTILPFDIAGFRVLFYEDSIGGKRKLEEGLRRHLAAILAS